MGSKEFLLPIDRLCDPYLQTKLSKQAKQENRVSKKERERVRVIFQKVSIIYKFFYKTFFLSRDVSFFCANFFNTIPCYLVLVFPFFSTKKIWKISRLWSHNYNFMIITMILMMEKEKLLKLTSLLELSEILLVTYIKLFWHYLWWSSLIQWITKSLKKYMVVINLYLILLIK